MDKEFEFFLKICSAFGIYIPQPRYASRRLQLFLTIYTVFLIMVLLLSCISGIILTPINSDYIISWFVSAIVFLSQMFTHLMIMWECLTKQQEHNDFLRLLNDIEVSFKLRLRLEFSVPLIMAKLRKTFALMAIISLSGLISFTVSIIVINDTGYFFRALMAILAMRLRFLQLLIYVELLRNYLLSLNKNLNQVVCLKTEHDKQLLDIDYKSLASLEYLNNIKEQYSSIYEAFHYFNEFAQLSLFAATASYFLDFTCHIYWSLLALDDLLPFTSIILAAATIIPLGLNIFKFCHICQLVKQECHRTSLMVGRLMVAKSDFTCLELKRNYQNLVYDFSLQLLQQRIEVTGKRFFNFDLKCIFAICSLIATHLIILIQFTKSDGGSENLNKTHDEAVYEP